MELVVAGCGFLIASAVVISGGKISITFQGLRAELPPLGEGIKRLRQAFGFDSGLRVGFGIREKVVKLNEEEYNSLCQQDDASWNEGGFQRFLIELKRRTNKHTRKLKLYNNDLERICRHMSRPERGGWQRRFRKIFGRHFPND